MELSLYQVDAFADQIFTGNPAAICPLNNWLPDSVLQLIAMENNLSETAFIVSKNDDFEIRWFTPNEEVELCGHATLASAYVVFRWLRPWDHKVTFHSKSGSLLVHHNPSNDEITLDFPALQVTPCDTPEKLVQGLGVSPRQVLKGNSYLAIYESERQIRHLKPDYRLLSENGFDRIIVTAPGDKVDFVSRFFTPNGAITEDPVTGSAHCILMPYWSRRVNKNRLLARQISKRGGNILCEIKNDRVYLTGKALPYLQGTITIPHQLL